MGLRFLPRQPQDCADNFTSSGDLCPDGSTQGRDENVPVVTSFGNFESSSSVEMMCARSGVQILRATP